MPYAGAAPGGVGLTFKGTGKYVADVGTCWVLVHSTSLAYRKTPGILRSYYWGILVPFWGGMKP